MEKVIEALSVSLVPIVGIICYTIYLVTKTMNRKSPYDEIERLHGLLQKGMVTQQEFDSKKRILLLD